MTNFRTNKRPSESLSVCLERCSVNSKVSISETDYFITHIAFMLIIKEYCVNIYQI